MSKNLSENVEFQSHYWTILLILAIGLFAVGINCYNKFMSQKMTIQSEGTGEEVHIQNKDYSYIFEKIGDVDVNLRIFGYNSIDKAFGGRDMVQYGVLSYLFIAAPMELNNRIFDKYFCERRSAEQSSMLQIIAENARVKNAINDLARSPQGQCAHIQGTALTLKEYQYKNNEPQTLWNFAGISSHFNYDSRKFILLSDIEAVPCRQSSSGLKNL